MFYSEIFSYSMDDRSFDKILVEITRVSQLQILIVIYTHVHSLHVCYYLKRKDGLTFLKLKYATKF